MGAGPRPDQHQEAGGSQDRAEGTHVTGSASSSYLIGWRQSDRISLQVVRALQPHIFGRSTQIAYVLPKRTCILAEEIIGLRKRRLEAMCVSGVSAFFGATGKGDS